MGFSLPSSLRPFSLCGKIVSTMAGRSEKALCGTDKTLSLWLIRDPLDHFLLCWDSMIILYLDRQIELRLDIADEG